MMRVFLSVTGMVSLMILAAWAFGENYATRAAGDRRAALQREIGALENERRMLEGELAYLARPDRLRVLADLNYSELRLVPMTPDAFGRMQEVPYPEALPPEVLALTSGAEARP